MKLPDGALIMLFFPGDGSVMGYKEEAARLHGCGQNCAQAVLCSCCEKYGLDPETASRMTAFFGAGMRSGEVCGAATGALMALGLEYGGEDNRKSDKSVRFLRAFQKEFGSVRCRELIGAEGQKKKDLCPVLIAWASEYLEEELK